MLWKYFAICDGILFVVVYGGISIALHIKNITSYEGIVIEVYFLNVGINKYDKII